MKIKASELWKIANYSLTHSMVLFLWNPKVHYRAHKSLPLDLILSHSNPVLLINPCLARVHLNVILLPTPRSSQWSLAFGPPNVYLSCWNELQHIVLVTFFIINIDWNSYPWLQGSYTHSSDKYSWNGLFLPENFLIRTKIKLSLCLTKYEDGMSYLIKHHAVKVFWGIDV